MFFKSTLRIVIVLGIWLAGTVYAAEQINPLFWKIYSKETTIYLLGSIHIAKEDTYPLPQKIIQRFEQASALVVEVDMIHIDMEQMAEQIRAYGMYEGEQGLQQQLSAESWDKFARLCRQQGVAPEVFHGYRPWLAAVSLITLVGQRYGYREELGIDYYFEQAAAASNKDILELENIDTQLAIFASFTPEEEEEFLLATLNDLEEGQASFVELMTAWQQGKAGDLDQLINDKLRTKPGLERVHKVLLLDRNQSMAHKIEALAKQRKNLFVVVGAAHLVGEQGIIEWFKNKGYAVERQ